MITLFNYWSLLHFSKCWPSICFSGQIFFCFLLHNLSRLVEVKNRSKHLDTLVFCSSVSLFLKGSVICPLRESEILLKVNCETFSDLAQNKLKLRSGCWDDAETQRNAAGVQWSDLCLFLPLVSCCKNWGESSTEKERERMSRPASWPFPFG